MDGEFWRISNLLAAAVTAGSPRKWSGHFHLSNQQQAVNPSESKPHSLNSEALESYPDVSDGEKN